MTEQRTGIRRRGQPRQHERDDVEETEVETQVGEDAGDDQVRRTSDDVGEDEEQKHPAPLPRERIDE